jgi:hypothetical protein
MLLWTLHPKYLDNKGLGALWFEGIIARNSLLGLSQGYQNHPQLDRFKIQPDPIAAIDTYLSPVYEEGISRGFQYNRALFSPTFQNVRMEVTLEQLKKEYAYLLQKLERRDIEKYKILKKIHTLEPHPMFDIID